MKVVIDISVFTEGAAIGDISGVIDVAIPPCIGDTLDFRCVSANLGLKDTANFMGLLKVTNRVIAVGGDVSVILTLEDIVAASPSDALIILNYFESEKGLESNIY